MTKPITIFFLAIFALSANAQTSSTASAITTTQPFGKVDIADLEMKTCDFEKDANAEILFNKGDVYYDETLRLTGEYHKRIKIFNDKAKAVANIRILFYGGNGAENVSSIQAETINLVDGKVEITKLDGKQIYLQHIDKNLDEWIFTMPNVKTGSVIEYKYKWTTLQWYHFPEWYFQDKIPARYSELQTEIPEMLYFKKQMRVWQPFTKLQTSNRSRSIGTGERLQSFDTEVKIYGLLNIPSLPNEPYMRSDADNLQRAIFELESVKSLTGFQSVFAGTWPKVGGILADEDDFGGQLKRKLNNEEAIISKAQALKNDDQKIAYVFNEVKNAMKWNGIDRYYTNDGTYKAWENKSGNSAEINLILYHLLKKSGVRVYPMLVSTQDHGMVNPYNPALYQFNRAVAYVPVDSTKNYILDATDKYNTYNKTPSNLLNSSGFYIDKESDIYGIIPITNIEPVRNVTQINATIKADGKMSGTVQISSSSYGRMLNLKKYKVDGEKKYIDYLRKDDNNLAISSVKFENMEVDSLPLIQNIDFNLDLTSSDQNYIYFRPNIFTSDYENRFLSENRATTIDFAYLKVSFLNGLFKIPAGYKVDATPQSVTMSMPDNSITFKRVIVEQDGSIMVRYTLNLKKSMFLKDEYPEFHEFFKKMNEMMNEQIVLKKI